MTHLKVSILIHFELICSGFKIVSSLFFNLVQTWKQCDGEGLSYLQVILRNIFVDTM
jgi:hypothetical protein